ncbi:MAG: polymer-forming cytoskeletal protein [Lachnospiraceae bacterium]|nr:polymer-forming cytoskeletal protein [Lachnospiraceae bacterium]
MSAKKTDYKISTIIGKDVVVEGDFSSGGSVRLDGVVEGNVKVGGYLLVGVSGKIHGDVEAASVSIGGEVTGNVEAPEKAELTSTARVIGDIRTGVIVIDEKAIFQGKCDMNQEELKPRRRPPRENRAGKRSAKEALRDALKAAEEEVKADQTAEEAEAASADVSTENSQV